MAGTPVNQKSSVGKSECRSRRRWSVRLIYSQLPEGQNIVVAGGGWHLGINWRYRFLIVKEDSDGVSQHLGVRVVPVITEAPESTMYLRVENFSLVPKGTFSKQAHC